MWWVSIFEQLCLQAVEVKMLDVSGHFVNKNFDNKNLLMVHSWFVDGSFHFYN